MRSARHSSLRVRLLLLILIAVIPALVVIVLSVLSERREAAAAAQRKALQIARVAAAEQRQLIAVAQQQLKLLAQLPPLIRLQPTACDRLLARLLTKDSPYANYGVIGLDGDVVCSALPYDPAVNLGDRSYFRRTLQSKGFAVGDYQIGRITGVATVNFSYPLVGPSGKLRGVVFAALPLRWLERQIRTAGLPPGYEATVVDQSGRVLARYPDSDGWIGRKVDHSRWSKALRRAGHNSVVALRGLDGVERLYAFSQLTAGPGTWVVYLSVGIPSKLAYARATNELDRSLWIFLLVVLLVFAAGWWGSRVFVIGPVNELLDATRRLARGDLRARAASVTRGGELGELAGAFNAMAEATEYHVDRIERLNRVYAVLSGINGAIVRIKDPVDLVNEACRVAVEQGGFRAAWIGLVDQPAEGLASAAQAGAAPKMIGELATSFWEYWCGREQQLGTAVGHQVVSGDLAEDASIAPWREQVLAYGLHSCAVLPLRVEGDLVGVFALFAGDRHFFDAEEIRLLDELASDTALGLEYIRKAQRVEYLAYFDVLTGLANRTLFEDRLTQALVRAKYTHRHAAALILDIDGFRRINDTAGHHAGDAVLQRIGESLRRALRDGDTVARLGNDEFGIVLADLARARDAEAVAHTLLEALPKAIRVQSEEIFVGVRIGIAVQPDDGDEAHVLIRNMELALQSAKSDAGGRIALYSPHMNARAQEMRTLEQELRYALERRELALNYQPIIDIKSRKLIGAEALLRWSNPDLGVVAPDRFIPVAEETGLIIPIGEWVLETAIKQSELWHGQGLPPLHLSVNVSVIQLRQKNFVERVAAILDATGSDVRSAHLGIELTESELMETGQTALAKLQALRELDIRLYIDDFGTGYSSLGYLRQLPVDALKIDRSFVNDLTNDANAVAIAKAIIAMAHGLDLRSVAEGVETREQLSILEELGCDAAQGYLFGKPQPAAEFQSLFGRSF